MGSETLLEATPVVKSTSFPFNDTFLDEAQDWAALAELKRIALL